MDSVSLVQIKLHFLHECPERGQAANTTLTAPDRRDKAGKKLWDKGGQKTPSNPSAFVKTTSALPSPVMLP